VLALPFGKQGRSRGHFRRMLLLGVGKRLLECRMGGCRLRQPCLELCLPLRELRRRGRCDGCMTLFSVTACRLACCKLLS
jgi:hypothetical protein